MNLYIQKYKPITPSARATIKIKKNILAKNNKLIKKSMFFYQKRVGKNKHNGQITSWHKGGSHVKNLYRNINLVQTNKFNNNITINTTFDPHRSAFINCNFDLIYKNFFYTPATQNVFPGSMFKNSVNLTEVKLGFRSTIENLPIGSIIHNLTIDKTNLSKYIRAAGTFGTILRCDNKKTQVKLPSKKIIEISSLNYATIGQISNLENNLIKIGKAGTNRLLGKRPKVRGIAMNSVDHPHGGRSNGGIPSVTPWGLPTKTGFYLRKKK